MYTALDTYKQIHNNLNVKSDYVIAANDERYPEQCRGVKLGVYVCSVCWCLSVNVYVCVCMLYESFVCSGELQTLLP